MERAAFRTLLPVPNRIASVWSGIPGDLDDATSLGNTATAVPRQEKSRASRARQVEQGGFTSGRRRTSVQGGNPAVRPFSERGALGTECRREGAGNSGMLRRNIR